MTKTASLNLRVDPSVKSQAEKILGKLGLTMTAAIDLYLRQISLTGGIPFSVTLPKAPDSRNIGFMTEKEFTNELQKGFDDTRAGRVKDAEEAFINFNRKINNGQSL